MSDTEEREPDEEVTSSEDDGEADVAGEDDD
jgi:hypothetical protein